MRTLLIVVGLAIAWHVGLALLERQRAPERDRPSLAKLLLLAEVEVLRTLRGELKRRLRLRRERQCERKLDEVEGRLRELDNNEARADV
ncbi:MAG: hypothetical protein QMD00_01255 [Hadesarchaea archaeon]|nr:hypothetical protein [Hadesarchaea archaeon]